MVDKSIKNVLSLELFEVFNLMIYLSLNIKLGSLFINNIKYLTSLFNSLGKEYFFSTKFNLIGLRVLNDLDFMHLFLLVKTNNLSKLKHLIDTLNLIPVYIFPQKVSRMMLQLVIEITN